MARAATADELLKLRSDGQKTKLYLTLDAPAVVYSARVNQATFTDPMVEVTYDGGTGTLANVKVGMTMMVGSAEGGHDLGLVRIRKTPTATKFYFNETSEIPFVDNAYLTVVDEMGVWQKHLLVKQTGTWMDYDISYVDQHDKLDPVPLMGGPAVLWLTEDTVDYAPPNGPDSWVLGSTISAYLWTAPGASATANLNTSTPTLTYNAAGRYRISLTVTAANGKSYTGYRYIFVYDSSHQPATNFELLSCEVDRLDGGPSFAVRLYDEASLSLVRERAMVILSARDWYGSVEGSIGSNIVAMGWIAEESIHWDPENNYVEFAVEGPQYWLNKTNGYPVGIEYTADAPEGWTQLQGLTVDAGLWHLLHWRSTVTAMMDVYLTGDTQYLPSAEAPTGSVWTQLVTIANTTILAQPVCDELGRLKIKVDTQYLSAADRATIPTVMTLTQDDLRDAVDFPVSPPEVAQVEASGIYYSGTKATPLISKAPGKTLSRFGAIRPLENLLVPTQARLNELSGHVYAAENNPYKNVDMALAANNRLIDVSEPCRLILSVGATDTVRGIVLVNQKFLPRKKSYEYDAAGGFLLTNVVCDAETSGTPGVTVPYNPPGDGAIADPPWDYDLDDGDLPYLNMPGLPGQDDLLPDVTPPEEQLPPGDGTCTTDAPANGPFLVIPGCTLYGNSNYRKDGLINCIIRSAAHTNRTKYSMNARVQKYGDTGWADTDDDAQYNVYAYNGAALIATGTHDAVSGNYQRTGYLDAIAAAEISAIRLELDGELMRPSEGEVASISPLYGQYVTDNGTLNKIAPEGAAYTMYGRYTWSQEMYIGIPGWAIYFGMPGLAGKNVTVDINAVVIQTGPSGHPIVKGISSCWYGIGATWGEYIDEGDTNGYYYASKHTKSAICTDQYYGVVVYGGFDWAPVPNTYVGTIYATVRWKLEPTYRILLGGLDLYNVCPSEAD